MKKSIMVSISLIILTSFTFAQSNRSPKAVYDKNNNMIAIYYIGTGLSKDEIEFCSIEKFSGKIISVGSEYPENSFVIQTRKRKEDISVNTENMSMADRSNFYESLLKKNKRVIVSAYMCGSGGFLYTTSVKAITVKKKVRTK